jgi:SAM-dependent methyltransferase
MPETLPAYLQSLFDDQGQTLARALESWRGGVAYEREFWTNWFATQGLSWPEEYASRMQPQPMADWHAAMLPPGPARVLDVGAGPITKAGTFVPGREVAIIAVDPLADIYAEIIAASGATVPLATQFAFGEDISARFDADSFDLILCTNALDHAIAPLWCLIEMLIVARQGASIILQHGVNEAEAENYTGFHQWNFSDEDGHFIIWNRESRLDATAILAACASIECHVDNHYITCIIRKREAVPMDRQDYHRRMRAALLRAALRL